MEVGLYEKRKKRINAVEYTDTTPSRVWGGGETTVDPDLTGTRGE